MVDRRKHCPLERKLSHFHMIRSMDDNATARGSRNIDSDTKHTAITIPAHGDNHLRYGKAKNELQTLQYKPYPGLLVGRDPENYGMMFAQEILRPRHRIQNISPI